MIHDDVFLVLELLYLYIVSFVGLNRIGVDHGRCCVLSQTQRGDKY